MPYNIYDLGDSIRVSATFTDADTQDAVDPDVVNLSIRTPDGTLTTYTYGVGGNVVKADVGQYYSIVDVNQSGSWFYRWWSTGFGQAAKEKAEAPHDRPAAKVDQPGADDRPQVLLRAVDRDQHLQLQQVVRRDPRRRAQRQHALRNPFG